MSRTSFWLTDLNNVPRRYLLLQIRIFLWRINTSRVLLWPIHTISYYRSWVEIPTYEGCYVILP
jgi:hypothetical protein